METAVNETLVSLMAGLGLEADAASEVLKEMAEQNSRYLKDLRINLSNSFNYQSLSGEEKALLSLAVAINEKNTLLEQAFLKKCRGLGIEEEKILETYACVSLLNVNNVFYRFRHFAKKDFYNDTPAGIKMSIMMNPVMGKEFFELMSLAVSALNGCELCVTSHEASLMNLGTTPARVYDAIRLTANLKGLAVLLR